MIEAKTTPTAEAERLSEKLFSLPEQERDQYRADVERRLAKAAYIADLNNKKAEADEAQETLKSFVYNTSSVLPGAKEFTAKAETRMAAAAKEKERVEAEKAAAEKRPKFIKKDYGRDDSAAHIQRLTAAKGKTLFTN